MRKLSVEERRERDAFVKSIGLTPWRVKMIRRSTGAVVCERRWFALSQIGAEVAVHDVWRREQEAKGERAPSMRAFRFETRRGRHAAAR